MKTALIFAAMLCLCLVPAGLAQTPSPHAIDFTAKLVGFDGRYLTNGDAKVPLTLSDAAVLSLEAPLEADRNMPGIERFKHDELARKIYNNSHAILSIEEIALIKDRIGKMSNPVVVGAAWRLLDPSLD
jgi:hypothetical protein